MLPMEEKGVVILGWYLCRGIYGICTDKRPIYFFIFGPQSRFRLIVIECSIHPAHLEQRRLRRRSGPLKATTFSLKLRETKNQSYD